MHKNFEGFCAFSILSNGYFFKKVSRRLYILLFSFLKVKIRKVKKKGGIRYDKFVIQLS